MRKKLLILFLAHLLAPTIAYACETKNGAEYCEHCANNGNACLITIKHKDYLGFEMHNRLKTPITLKLDLTLNNMTTEKDVPNPIVLSNSSDVFSTKLLPENKGSRYHFNVNFQSMLGDYRDKHDSSHVYNLPYESGQAFVVSQGYGGNFSHKDKYAVDFAMPEGTKILAGREGRVVKTKANSNSGGPSREHADKANYIYIQHPDGTIAGYLHLKHNGVLVNVGDRVQAGQAIGLSGGTGWSSMPHLHFEVASSTKDAQMRTFKTLFRTSSGVVSELEKGKLYKAR